MFGYVRPSPARLTGEDIGRYQGLYCGLCREMGRRCGIAARFTLNYDFVFLAALLSPSQPGELLRGKCIAHPFKARGYYPENTALALSADCGVILTWQQLRDGLRDRDVGQGKYRLALAALGRGCRLARERRPDFDREVEERLGELHRLEEENCPSLDRPADAFARLLSGVSREVEEPVKARVLEQMLYHLGRWIYLADAADDLEKDFSRGCYNPLIARFSLTEGKLTEEARRTLVLSLDGSIRRMAAAFELWDFGVWRPILASVVYEGLYLVGNAVLEGTFHAADPLFLGGRDEEAL